MKFIIMALCYLYSFTSFAILPFEDAVSPELVTSARALAMGNSYMGKVDDAWSSFYNPAGLGTVRGLQFHVGNFHFETNQGFLDVTTAKGNIFSSVSKLTSAFKPTGLRDLHSDNPGALSHARLQFFPNITYRGVSLGYLYVKQNRARLKSSTSDFEISERTDSGPVFSLNLSLMGGVFKVGASAVYLTRSQLQKDFAETDTIEVDESTDYKRASTTLITTGVRLTFPIKFLPTFSAVFRNSSNSDWYNDEFSGAPDKIPQTIDYGFSITPMLGRTLRMHLDVSMKDSTDKYKDVPSSRKLQAGIEFDYKRVMFVRFGYGDGWGSGGIGIRTKEFIFDMTSYAIEGSDSGHRKEEDRRFALSLSSGF